MKKLYVGIFLSALVMFVSTPLQATETYYLAQIAEGLLPDNSAFSTTFVFVNNSNRFISGILLEFFGDNGQPLALPLIDISGTSFGTSSQFTISVLALGTVRVLTPGTRSPLVVGWARVTSPTTLAVSAAFQFFDANDRLITEAGVGPSKPMRRFTLFADKFRDFTDTGIALVNTSETQTAEVVLALRRRSGLIHQDPLTFTLAPREHRALFLPQFGFSGIDDFEGSLGVFSTQPLAAIALRVDSNELTTFPVSENVGSSATPVLLALTSSRTTAPRSGSFSATFTMSFGAPANINNGRLIRETIFYPDEDVFSSVEFIGDPQAGIVVGGNTLQITIQGFGFAPQDTHLVERFTLIDNNGFKSNTMSIIIIAQ